MKKFNKIHIKYCLLLLLPLVVACNKIYFSGGEKVIMKTPAFFEKLDENSLEFNSFLLKASGELVNGNDKQNFQLNARIKQDSLVWISLRMLGIEGMRFMLTTDSVFMLDRLNKQYLTTSYEDLSDLLELEINYHIFQNALTNKFFVYPPSNDEFKANEFNNCRDPEFYCVSTMKTRKYKRLSDTSSNYYKRNVQSPDLLDDENSVMEDNYFFQLAKFYHEIFKPAQIYIENITKNQSLEIQYNKLTMFSSVYFPSEISINVNTSNLKFMLNMNTEKIEINTDNNTPFKLPANYKQIKF